MANSTKFGSFGAGSHDKSINKNIFITNNKFKNVGRAIGSHAWEGSTLAPNGCAEGVYISGVVSDGTKCDIIRPEAWKDFSIQGVQNLGTVLKNGLLIDDCDRFSISDCNLRAVAENGIIVRAVENVTTSTFSIDGITITGGIDGIDLKDALNADVDKVQISNVTGMGVRLTDCKRVTIQAPKLSNCGYNGIKAITSNTITIAKGNIQSSGASGVYFEDCEFSLIEGVTVSSPQSGNCISLGRSVGSSTIRVGVDVKNCTLVANNQSNIDNGGVPIDGLQAEYHQDCTFSGNTVRTTRDGIKFVTCDDINVTGNTSTFHTDFGFKAATSSYRVSFAGNMARSNATGNGQLGTGTGGLYMTGSGGKHFVNANDFAGSGDTPIKDNTTGADAANVVAGGNNI